LRLLDNGVNADAFAVRHGVTLDAIYGSTIDELVVLGLMERQAGGVRLTHRGLLLANDVIARFL
jgi:coproporphyrinogen III oxidase-like Fe-S oxidoreductase